MLKPGEYTLFVFEDESGEKPYIEWLLTLDPKTQHRIRERVRRMAHGQFGDFKALGGELYELRIFFGPGYRVYFGEDAGRIIVLLTGGDKSTQRSDIAQAKQYWKTYLETKDEDDYKM